MGIEWPADGPATNAPVPAHMRIAELTLTAPPDLLAEVAEFYGGALGLEGRHAGDAASFRLGASRLRFRARPEAAFHHFALLVPDGRFQAAFDWLTDRAEPLSAADGEGPVFEFDVWQARACYCLDPAGNIVELICHEGVGEGSATGAFAGRELLAISEFGLVGDTAALAAALAPLGLELWDGELGGPRLAFVGERAHTLILSPRGRGWLPTGRPAEAFAAEVIVSGCRPGEIRPAGTPYRVQGRPA